MDIAIVRTILMTSVVVSFFFGLWGIINLISGIINYKSPELVCAKCGCHLTKDNKKCPRCKIELK